MSRRRQLPPPPLARRHPKTVELVCSHSGTMQRNKAPVKIALLTIFGRSDEGVSWRVEHLTHNPDPLTRGLAPLPSMDDVVKAALTGKSLPQDTSDPHSTRRFRCSRCPIDVTATDVQMYEAVTLLRDTGLIRIPLEAVAASLSRNS